MPLWQTGHLGFVHASGSPDPTRSHFDAQDYTNALKFYEMLTVAAPADANSWIAAGAAAFNGGDDAKAFDNWTQATKADPKNVEAHYKTTGPEIWSQMRSRAHREPDAFVAGVGTGGTIMGSDARNSVTNQWCQTWDVKNLFITDGGPFVSNADKNPTLTIMALAWRASDYLIGEMKRGNI